MLVYSHLVVEEFTAYEQRFDSAGLKDMRGSARALPLTMEGQWAETSGSDFCLS